MAFRKAATRIGGILRHPIRIKFTADVQIGLLVIVGYWSIAASRIHDWRGFALAFGIFCVIGAISQAKATSNAP